jgi:hypothetical protein
MTLRPRPASPDWPYNVETDHPREGAATSHCAVVNELSLEVQRSVGPTDSRAGLGQACRLRWADMARCASIRSCLSRSVWRLSCSFLPLASAISTLARPSTK